ncbi:uncharacterized protein LOC144704323 [Wolffia australiana]
MAERRKGGRKTKESIRSSHGATPRRSARLAALSPTPIVSPGPGGQRKRKTPPSVPSRSRSPQEPLLGASPTAINPAVAPPPPSDPLPERSVTVDPRPPPRVTRGRPQMPLPEEEERRTRVAEAQRLKAVAVAPEYAFFTPEDDEEEEMAEEEESGDWPGPFSTAMKIINDRERLLLARGSPSDPPDRLPIERPPPSDQAPAPDRRPPSLRELSLATLCDYASEIKSLRGVPDELRNRLSRRLCDLRKMDEQALRLFFEGSPAEVAIPDCAWATEDQLDRALARAATDRLTALELGLCGRCLHDGTLASPAGGPRFAALTAVSLKGAYRLTDDGLAALAESAPRLRAVDLSQCSRLSSAGLCEFLRLLRSSLSKLCVDDCALQASALLPGLTALEKLDALSVAAVDGVSDRFVRAVVAAHGPRLAELGFSRCRALTEASTREISKDCPSLRSVDFRDVVKLDDRALAHLAGGGAALRRLLLRRNPLSDKAVAAFLEAAGGALTELSVNNIREASNFTAQAVATRCAVNLLSLDLSFCRRMTIEGLGLIAGSCSGLQTLKLFGCPQITPSFVAGQSSGRLHVVGLDGPILRCS